MFMQNHRRMGSLTNNNIVSKVYRLMNDKFQIELYLSNFKFKCNVTVGIHRIL